MKNGELTEGDIQNSILELLRFKGIYSWRNNTVGVYDPTRGRHRSRGRYDINGVSDILGILPDGRFLAIEVKGPKGRTSEDQRKFIDNVSRNGGIGFVTKGVGKVKDVLNELGY